MLAAQVTPELIADLKLVEEVRISPDGKSVSYVVKHETARDGRQPRELWLAAAEGPIQSRRLLPEAGGVTEPRWSPDGKFLAAFATSDAPPRARRLVLWEAASGTTTTLVDSAAGMSDLDWSPDSRFLSYTAKDPTAPKKSVKGEPRLLGVSSGTASRVWLLERASGARRVVTPPEANVGRYAWSPRSDALVIAHTPLDSFLAPLDTISVVPIATGVARKLFEAHDQTIRLAWSPDGQTIAWCGREHAPDSGQLQLIAAAGGTPRTVQADFPGSLEWMDYRRDGRIAFGAVVNLRVGLYSIAGDGSDLRVEHAPEAQAPGSLGCGSFTTFAASFSADGTRVAVPASGPRDPASVFAGRWGGTLTPRTALNPEVAALTLGTVEDISWRSFDGRIIHGLLVKPPGFDPQKKYPFITEVHGGPRRSWWATCLLNENIWAMWFASQGHVVLLPNPRGSEGRGAEFVRANTNDIGGGDWRDVVAGFNHVLALGYTERERMGLAGFSYGGYLTAWGITQPEGAVFKAAVVGAGITNWLSREGASGALGMWPRLHWGNETALWRSPQDFFQRSPIAHIAQVRAAVLLLHGEADNKVPPGQAIEFYNGLRARGLPVEGCIYPGEGHGFNDRAHKIDSLRRMAGWFALHLAPPAGTR